MKKKSNLVSTYSIIGIIIGLIAIILGVLILNGEFGGKTQTPYNSPYDSGYAKFNADFYTYVNNNTAEAAKAAIAIAENQMSIAKLFQNVLGIFIMAVGAFMVCFFGIKYADCSNGHEIVIPQKNDITADKNPESASYLSHVEYDDKLREAAKKIEESRRAKKKKTIIAVCAGVATVIILLLFDNLLILK